MAQTVGDLRDINFVLFEQLGVDKMTEDEKYSDFNRKTFEMIIKEARKFSLKEILPTYSEGDKEGVKSADIFHASEVDVAGGISLGEHKVA